MIELNKYQTPLEKLKIEEQSKEFQEKYWDFFYNVPFIQSLVSKKRKKAKDCQRDPNFSDGRIIVDLEHPHILEDMDYFRQAAITYENTGKYTELKPNPNPNSEYYKWLKEEIWRCHNGMVRPSDGEWIPGDMYFYLNYIEMQIADKTKQKDKKTKKALRVYKMPKVWDGVYWYFHYLWQAREEGNHSCMLSSRGRSKSYVASSKLAKIFKLGESPENNRGCTCYITASDKKYLVAGDQTLDKFQHNIDFISQNTEWPGREMLQNRLNDMIWTAGYKDLDYGNKGTGNSVVGISSNNDEQKLRGTRAVLYVIEEGGTFNRLDKVWQNILPSVEQGQGDERAVYGQIMLFGTAGDDASDFQSLAKMMYHPVGYHIKALNNIYDIVGKGGKTFSFFYPAYINNEGCYDKDGNSDVTKALFQILKDRENIKNNSADINAIIKRTAEYPIVPQEAIMRTTRNVFPVQMLNERINELRNDRTAFDDVLVGELVMAGGKVDFNPTDEIPIHTYPLGEGNAKGAVEIFSLPKKNSLGIVEPNRYIASFDPVDMDEANSVSLASCFVMDLFTDSIVAEYTGRKDTAYDNYEIVRRLCIFYNARCLYESNIIGTYTYFKQMNSLRYLAETPAFLKDRELISRLSSIGSAAFGVKATTPIINFENQLIRDWLVKPNVVIRKNEAGEDEEVTVCNLHVSKNVALLEELSKYDSFNNFDRVRSFGLLMIYREQYMTLYNGDLRGHIGNKRTTIFDDDFFKDNY